MSMDMGQEKTSWVPQLLGMSGTRERSGEGKGDTKEKF